MTSHLSVSIGAFLREKDWWVNADMCQQLYSLLLSLMASLGGITKFTKTEKTRRFMKLDTYTMRVPASSSNGLPSKLATLFPNLAKRKKN